MKVVETLADAECWNLLGAKPLGRLALVGDGGIDIFPVNYVVRDQVIYFRSAPGSKLAELTAHPDVAFEVDGTHRSKHWSVVAKGRAERMAIDTEIEASGVLELETANPTEKWNYVRIVPTTVTGRRF